MADVASTLAAWSTTAASNLPTGATPISSNLDDNLRQIQAVVRTLASSNTIASATTTDLSTINETFVTVSGTTAITGLGTVSAGIFKWLLFSGALTLTHNATSLISPTGANITTEANGVAVVQSLGSGNWRIWVYIPASVTGSGAAVRATSPSLTTPNIGVATATSVNKVAITAPATSATLTIADGKTLTASDDATVSGTNTGDQLVFKTITVSGQSDVVADSTTDTLTLAAGTGITITTNASTDTVTIASTVSAPNTFGTISVSGQSDVVADSATDTLTLAAGSGISITTNAATDTITIASSISASAVTLLSTVTASTSATVDIETTFNSTYDAYVIVASGVTVGTDGSSLQLRMKIGGSYDTGSNYVFHMSKPNSAASTYSGSSGSANSSVNLLPAVGNAASKSANFEIWVFNPSSTAFSKQIKWSGECIDDTGVMASITGAAHNTGTSALTGIRIFASSGNINAGKFRLYGISNS